VNIYNQCLSIELVSPVYFGNGVVCSEPTDQQTDIGAKMNASFEISTIQDGFEGALLYKLQRYFESGGQCNTDTPITETNNGKKKYVQMFVAWKMKDSKPFVYVALIEHTQEFTWNEDELRKLYDGNCNWFKEYNDTISDIWFIDNNVTLETSLKVRSTKGSFKLSASISEYKDDYPIRPLCVDLER
jgi:hypothetical protein